MYCCFFKAVAKRGKQFLMMLLRNSCSMVLSLFIDASHLGGAIDIRTLVNDGAFFENRTSFVILQHEFTLHPPCIVYLYIILSGSWGHKEILESEDSSWFLRSTSLAQTVPILYSRAKLFRNNISCLKQFHFYPHIC